MIIKINVTGHLELNLDVESDIKDQIQEYLNENHDNVKLAEADPDTIQEAVQDLIDQQDIEVETDTEIKIVK